MKQLIYKLTTYLRREWKAIIYLFFGAQCPECGEWHNQQGLFCSKECRIKFWKRQENQFID